MLNTHVFFTVGLELTWLPRRPRSKWQEFRRKRDAWVRATQLATRIQCHKESWNIFTVKADPFRVSSQDQPHNAWCVEVNNDPFRVQDFLDRGASYMAVQNLYQAASELDLHPHVAQPNPDGTILEWPTGGGHIHVGLDFLHESASTLLFLYMIERRACLDYVNYPFIRWLFSQWMDDTNSALPLTAQQIRTNDGWVMAGKKASEIEDAAHEAALSCHSIKQRFAYTGKPALPTWEFRFLDMPRTPEELRLQIQFLSHWLSYRSQPSENASYTLTHKYFKRLTTNMGFAKEECTRFFDQIGLDFQDYIELCWDRNYLPRMRHGKPV